MRISILLAIASIGYGYTISQITTEFSAIGQEIVQGSIGGGTIVFLWGDFHDTHPTEFTITVGGSDCEIIDNQCSSSYIKCRTPPAPGNWPDDYEMSVFFMNEPVNIRENKKIFFKYTFEDTPFVYWGSPPETIIGQKYSLHVKRGEKDFFFEKKGEYGIKTPRVYIENEGNAIASWMGEQWSFEGESYYYRIVPEVTSISYSRGSANGGLELTVYGAGFSKEKDRLEVNIDGTKCDVVDINDHSIKCLTTPGNFSDKTVYEGGNGFTREIWDYQSYDLDFDHLIGVISPDRIENIVSLELLNQDKRHTKSRLYGWFKPRTSGVYNFYCSGQGMTEIFLTLDEQNGNALSILKLDTEVGPREYFLNDNSKSKNLPLEGGKRYYLEIRHSNGEFLTNFSIGLKAPGTSESLNKLPLVQKMTIKENKIEREYQELFIQGNPQGGELQIRYGASVTRGIEWDPSLQMWRCEDLLEALREIDVENILCEGTRSDHEIYYKVTFAYDSTDIRYPFEVNKGKLEPVGYVRYHIRRNEEYLPQKIDYRLRFRGEAYEFSNTDPLEDLQANINRSIRAFQMNLIVYAKQLEGEIDLYFLLPSRLFEGIQDKLEISSLNHFSDKDSVMIERPGSKHFLWVVPSDFLRTIETQPQVNVLSNGVSAACTGNCSFTYFEPPVITGFSLSDSILFLTGTNFSENKDDISISLGGVECEILTADLTAYSCLIETQVAGSHVPVVTDKMIGKYSLTQDIKEKIEFLLEINSISPETGGSSGGTLIKITGVGFSPNSNDQAVMIGNSPCEIISSSFTELECLSTPMTTNSTLSVEVNRITATSNNFSYSTDKELSITSIHPKTANALYSSELIITGNNFGIEAETLSVTIGDQKCLIADVTNTEITCKLNGGPIGSHTLEIARLNYGSVIWDSKYQLSFEILSISHKTGSIEGGTEIEIKGIGFPRFETMLRVIIGKITECNVTHIEGESTIHCTTPPLPAAFTKEIPYKVEIIVKSDILADCSNDCSFTWSEDATPSINSIVPRYAKAGESLMISGKHLSANAKVTIEGVQVQIIERGQGVISAILPEVKGIYPRISLEVEGKGIGRVDAEFLNAIVISSTSPKRISKGGGNVLIYGSGFHEGLEISFDEVPCQIIHIFNKFTVCELSQYFGGPEYTSLNVLSGGEPIKCTNEEDCKLVFDDNLTPEISTIEGNLRIKGKFMGDDKKLVFLGDYRCRVTHHSSQEIQCIPETPPGRYSVRVFVENQGFSIGWDEPEVGLIVDSITTVYSSYAGGTRFEIKGGGLTKEATVTICGARAAILAATGDTMSISTPEIATVFTIDHFNENPRVKLLSEYTILSSNDDSGKYAFDRNSSTFFYDERNSDKWIGIDVGEGKVFQLSLLEIAVGGLSYLEFSTFEGSRLQGSHDGVGWETVFAFQTVDGYWNEFNARKEVYRYRFYRIYKENAHAHYYINELHLNGLLLLKNEESGLSCDMRITYSNATNLDFSNPDSEYSYSSHSYSGKNNAVYIASSAIMYDTEHTPRVDSISPTVGSIQGGMLVSITGAGFGNVSDGTTVAFDNVDCPIHSLSDDTIKCITGPKSQLSPSSFTLHTKAKGHAMLLGNKYIYSELWSHPSTWGGLAPPIKGEIVRIPHGKTIILDIDTPLLGDVFIEGTLMIRDIKGVKFEANSITIDSGSFITEREPTNDIDVILYGEYPIVVKNGRFEIFGEKRTPINHLEESVRKGDRHINLVEGVEWREGEEIRIDSLSFDRGEIRKIIKVNEKRVELDKELVFDHILNGKESIQVDLLSRNLKMHIPNARNLIFINSDVKIEHLELMNTEGELEERILSNIPKDSNSFIIGSSLLYDETPNHIAYTNIPKVNFNHQSAYIVKVGLHDSPRFTKNIAFMSLDSGNVLYFDTDLNTLLYEDAILLENMKGIMIPNAFSPSSPAYSLDFSSSLIIDSPSYSHSMSSTESFTSHIDSNYTNSLQSYHALFTGFISTQSEYSITFPEFNRRPREVPVESTLNDEVIVYIQYKHFISTESHQSEALPYIFPHSHRRWVSSTPSISFSSQDSSSLFEVQSLFFRIEIPIRALADPMRASSGLHSELSSYFSVSPENLSILVSGNTYFIKIFEEAEIEPVLSTLLSSGALESLLGLTHAPHETTEDKEEEVLEVYLLFITGIILFIFVLLLALIGLKCVTPPPSRRCPSLDFYQKNASVEIEVLETEKPEENFPEEEDSP